jgi:hypothetical protein
MNSESAVKRSSRVHKPQLQETVVSAGEGAIIGLKFVSSTFVKNQQKIILSISIPDVFSTFFISTVDVLCDQQAVV